MNEPEIVLKAISTLYGKDQAAAAEANIWLAHFQKSNEAWEVCDKLLREEHDGISSYFSAQTLRTKIQNELGQLPKEAQASLRDSLLAHLTTFGARGSDDDRVIVTQLSVAIADLYLQNFQWSNFIPEILTRLGGVGSSSRVLLTLLKVFPEENESSKLRLGANRREQVAKELAAHTSDLLGYLATVWEAEGSTSTDSVSRVLACLAAWLLNKNLPTQLFAESPLLPALFSILSSDESEMKLKDSATECLVQALFLCEDLNKHALLIEKLFTGIHALEPVFHMAVAKEDSELVENLARIFTELGETLLPAMVDGREGLGSLSTLNLVLITVGYHDYAVAEMSFNVWYRLSEFLYQRDEEARNDAFRPYIERFLMALFRHSALGPDHEGTPDEAEDLAEFRDKVTEAVKDVVFLVGSANAVRHMLGVLSAQSPWEETEAALHIVCAVAKNICPDEEEVVPSLVDAVLALPTDAHIAVRYTATRLLSQLWEWLHAHPDCLARALAWLLHNIQEKKLLRITVETLEMLACAGARTSAAALAAFLPQLSQALEALDALSPKIPEDTILSLLRATARVIASLPGEEAATHLTAICSSQAHFLTEAMTAATVDENGNSGSSRTRGRNAEPVKWLDRLSAILRQLESPAPPASFAGASPQPPPWSPIVHQMWPVMSRCLGMFEGSQRAVEHCCKTIRFAIRSLGVDSFDFIPQLVNQMVEIYMRQPHSCFLYLGSILVDEYGSFPQIGPGLLTMLQELTDKTLILLSVEHGYRDHPDTIDDLFRLCNRFVQRAPFPFFECRNIRPILDMAAAALKLDHHEAHLSVTKFINTTTEFVSHSAKQRNGLCGETAGEVVLGAVGGSLVLSAVEAAAFHLSRAQIRNIPDVLFSLRRLDPDKTSEWLQQALTHEPAFGGFGVTQEQILTFHAAVMGAREAKAILAPLKDFIQLFR